MLDEMNKYIDGLPINIVLANIDEYPIHRHNSLEIVCVLAGEIELKVSYTSYTMSKGELQIISGGDLHSIYKKSESDLVLILQIDLNFYADTYPGIKDSIFICEKQEDGIACRKVAGLLIRMTLEIVHSKTDYRAKVLAMLNDCLEIMINNFQYICMEENMLKNKNRKYKYNKYNKWHIDRLQRILAYLYLNYPDNLTLESVATKEHISRFYLAHLLKETLGMGFQDCLSTIRAERSEFLLLGTNKSIGDIVSECGFSSNQYYNKHFKICFGMKPSEYRNFYKNQTIEFRSAKLICYDNNQIQQILKDQVTEFLQSPVLMSAATYYVEVIQMEDCSRTDEVFDIGCDTIDLLDVHQGMFFEYRQQLLEFQTVACFKKIRLHLEAKNFKSVAFWENIAEFLLFLRSINLTPVLVINYNEFLPNHSGDEWRNRLNHFFGFLVNKYGSPDLKFLQIEVMKEESSEHYIYYKSILNFIADNYRISLQETNADERVFSLNSLYDTEFMSGYIVFNLASGKDLYNQKIFLTEPYVNEQTQTFFFGGPGLITVNGLKKPAYYAYVLLSKMGNELLYRGNGYIVTKRKDDIQVLLYNFSAECNCLYQKNDTSVEILEKQLYGLLDTKCQFSLRIPHILNNYLIKQYRIGKDCGSAYQQWINTGCISFLSKENKELINRITFPKTMFSQIAKNENCSLDIVLDPFEVELILFEKNTGI